MGKTLVESNTGGNTEGTETPASRRTEGTEGRAMQSMALPGILH